MLFFSAVSPEALELLKEIQELPVLNDFYLIKTDFIRHHYPLLKPILKEDGIKLASVEDIAAMKLNSIMNRGSKKDFYDVYELLNHFTLKELISFYTSKYNLSSQLIVLKSLVYFDDAEQEPDPASVKQTSWSLVKQKITGVVNKVN